MNTHTQVIINLDVLSEDVLLSLSYRLPFFFSIDLRTLFHPIKASNGCFGWIESAIYFKQRYVYMWVKPVQMKKKKTKRSYAEMQ